MSDETIGGRIGFLYDQLARKDLREDVALEYLKEYMGLVKPINRKGKYLFLDGPVKNIPDQLFIESDLESKFAKISGVLLIIGGLVLMGSISYAIYSETKRSRESKREIKNTINNIENVIKAFEIVDGVASEQDDEEE